MSIERMLKVIDPLETYFLELSADGEVCPKNVSSFFTSVEAKCTMYFLGSVLFDVQKRNLELQRPGVSIIVLSRIINSLMHQLHSRLKNEYYGQNTRILLDSLEPNAKQKMLDSFTAYIQNIVAYVNSYYNEHHDLCESVSVLGPTTKKVCCSNLHAFLF